MNLEALTPFCEDDDSNEFALLRPHPHLGLGGAPGIVVPHRHWLSAQAWDIVQYQYVEDDHGALRVRISAALKDILRQADGVLPA